jgi:hypothetical protein
MDKDLDSQFINIKYCDIQFYENVSNPYTIWIIFIIKILLGCAYDVSRPARAQRDTCMITVTHDLVIDNVIDMELNVARLRCAPHCASPSLRVPLPYHAAPARHSLFENWPGYSGNQN